MHRKLKIFAATALLASLVLSGAGARQTSASPAAQAQTWTLMSGATASTEQGEKPNWQMLKFYADDITINVGDTVMWKHNSGPEPHTVTFMGPEKTLPEEFMPEGDPNAVPPSLVGNPMLFFPQGGATYDGSAFTSSGLVAEGIPGPKDYKLTFTKPGAYDYICIIHVVQMPDGSFMGMKGKVTVQEAGAAVPKTPAQVEADAMAKIKADQDAVPAKEAEMMKMAKPASQGPNGTMVHHVNVGYLDFQNLMEYQRFWPKSININQGDTVEWSLPTAGFHTVSFGEEPEAFIFEPQPAGPPKVKLNPLLFPAGGSTHTGTGYFNSGIMAGPDDPPEAGVKSYSLTFAQPGRYEYICIPHYHNGMDATVTVMAKMGSAPMGGGMTESGMTHGEGMMGPGMPRTGNGADATLPLAALALSLALVLAGVATRSRKSGSIR